MSKLPMPMPIPIAIPIPILIPVPIHVRASLLIPVHFFYSITFCSDHFCMNPM